MLWCTMYVCAPKKKCKRCHPWKIHVKIKCSGLTFNLPSVMQHKKLQRSESHFYFAMKSIKNKSLYIVSLWTYEWNCSFVIATQIDNIQNMNSFCHFFQLCLLFNRFYGKSEDGGQFLDSIRTLFLSISNLMDRPLDEGVKIKAGITTNSYRPLVLKLFRLFCRMLPPP